jgi:hypothetical protein
MLHIASILAGDMALGSLASLNVVDRETRTVTLPVLYEMVILDKDIAGTDTIPLRNWMALNGGNSGYVK